MSSSSSSSSAAAANVTMLFKLSVILLALCWLSNGVSSAAISEEPDQLMADESADQISDLDPNLSAHLMSRHLLNDEDQDGADEDERPSQTEVVRRTSDELDQQDTNIENAKVQVSANDMVTAAGHHHHHGHYVHGKLDMGAHTSKKGAFGWHAKYPVGGKGRK